MISENFLDLDTAYLLGLIVIRGHLIETAGDHRIVIDFPSKNLLATGIKLKFEQKKHLRLGASGESHRSVLRARRPEYNERPATPPCPGPSGALILNENYTGQNRSMEL